MDSGTSSGTLPNWISLITGVVVVLLGDFVASLLTLGTLGQIGVTLLLLAVFGTALDRLLNR